MTGINSQYPSLSHILDKLHRNINLSADEISDLTRQVEELESRDQDRSIDLLTESLPLPQIKPSRTFSGHGTRAGTHRFASRSGKTISSFYRSAQDVIISSIGIGTYRGALDDADDALYKAAVHQALLSGINLIDTAINYRHQRSERAVASGIQSFIDTNAGSRDEFVVCTKGGFLVPGAIPTDCITSDDVVEGMHCLAPAFLADQMGRSKSNLGLETIDVYYLHNPETQLKTISNQDFQGRIGRAFEFLERAVVDGWIRYYGIATWNGLRDGTLTLGSLVAIARDVAGDKHHFRFVQLPFSLGMREAAMAFADADSVLGTASDSGITVLASASLWQGRLTRNLPAELSKKLPALATDAQRSIQFTRSSPGITSALVGMRLASHVRENLALSDVPPLSKIEYESLSSVLNNY